jgi:hypothetical protein
MRVARQFIGGIATQPIDRVPEGRLTRRSSSLYEEKAGSQITIGSETQAELCSGVPPARDHIFPR